MLQNEYLVAKFGFDTAKNEPRQVLQFLAGKLELNTVVYDRIRQLRADLDMKRRSGSMVAAVGCLPAILSEG